MTWLSEEKLNQIRQDQINRVYGLAAIPNLVKMSYEKSLISFTPAHECYSEQFCSIIGWQFKLGPLDQHSQIESNIHFGVLCFLLSWCLVSTSYKKIWLFTSQLYYIPAKVHWSCHLCKFSILRHQLQTDLPVNCIINPSC